MGITAMSEWFDYRTLASVGDGNPISSWAGRRGLYTATGSGTARPTFDSDAGDGRGAVSMDGVDDNLQFAMTNGGLYGPNGYCELWCVVKIPVESTTDRTLFLSGFGAGTTVVLGDNITSERWYFNFGTMSNFGNAAATHDAAWHVLRFSSKPTGVDWFIDGVSIGVNTVGALSWSAGSAMAFIGSSSGDWLGNLRHFMAFTAPLDDTTAAALTSYLLTA